MLSAIEDENEVLKDRINALERENEELKHELSRWVLPGLHSGTDIGGLFGCCYGPPDVNPNEPPILETGYDVGQQPGFGLFSCCQNVVLRPPCGSKGFSGTGENSSRSTDGAIIMPLTAGGSEGTARGPPAGIGAVVSKVGPVEFDGCRTITFRAHHNQELRRDATSSIQGGIQFEADGLGLSYSVILKTTPAETGCYLGFAPRSAHFSGPPVSEGFFFYCRHQTLYAEDGTSGEDLFKEGFPFGSGQRLTLTIDGSNCMKIYRDGLCLGDCRFRAGRVLHPGVAEGYLPTVLFSNHDTTLMLADAP